MKLPPFLLGAAILFWGWQTGFWIMAIPLAIIYETAIFTNWRWDLTTANFRQTSHVCTVLLVGVLIYLLISDRSLQLIFSFFQWLPIICAPLLIAQTYSTSDCVDLHALLFFKEKDNQEQLFSLNLTYPYFVICILAASAANTRELSFYVGIVVLIYFVLNSIRSKRYSYFVFLALLLVATALGTVGHLGLSHLQMSMERHTYRLFSNFYRPQTDPNQVSTAIGDLGSVKQSNEIILRVKPAPGQLPPELLRRATYNRYSSGFWGTVKAEFKPLKPSKEEVWKLQNQSSQDQYTQVRKLTISEKLDDGQTLLKLPGGSFRLAKLPIAKVEKIEQNQYGTVQVLSDSNLLSYQVQYDLNLSGDSPPTAEDLQVIGTEKTAIEQIITELDLATKSPQEVLVTVNKFFNTEFDYSLKLARQGRTKTPLSAFLLSHRSGHCEYFATATALLLRGVGIPTRYVVGYSVHELSNLEKQYIVRSRHAHAWTQVYINDKWQAFDTTPASWISIEDNAASFWQDFQDWESLLSFKFAQALFILQNAGGIKYLWILALPGVVVVIRLFFRQGDRRRLTAQRINQHKSIDLDEGANIKTDLGTDSEIYLIEQRLNKLGLKRDRAETWQNWLLRLQNSTETESTDIVHLVPELGPIIELHYRYRFDPDGISSREREKLRIACQNWLNKLDILIADHKLSN